jgi:hypothetical protein
MMWKIEKRTVKLSYWRMAEAEKKLKERMAKTEKKRPKAVDISADDEKMPKAVNTSSDMPVSVVHPMLADWEELGAGLYGC